jgi:hypothetical protein
MCLACEEQEYFFRAWVAGLLARGEMPPGMTAEDVQAMGFTPPNSTQGTDPAPASPPVRRADAFACDTPDE